VTGAPQQPTVAENPEMGINEYGSHVVDVLDVIGKFSDTNMLHYVVIFD
jgi:hypothetical protein